MKIHEFQGKQILRKEGVAVLDGKVARTAEEAAAAYRELGGELAVVKAQIHAGGRGKGTIMGNESQRGVQLVRSAEEAQQVAANLLGNKLVTIQTGPEGQTVNQVFVEAGCDIERELYLGIVFGSGKIEARTHGLQRGWSRNRKSSRRDSRVDSQGAFRPTRWSGLVPGS